MDAMDIVRGRRRAQRMAATLAGNGQGGTTAGDGDGDGDGVVADFGNRPLQQTPMTTGAAATHAHQTPDQDHGSDHDIENSSSGGGPTAAHLRALRFRRALIRRARESMPAGDSDDSGSEPDLSVLAAARYRGELADLDIALPEEMEPEDTSVEDDMDVEAEEEVEDGEEQPPLVDPATLGLKEISNLGKFTVSSHKQGNGVEELRSDDLNLYWQSDGPQPHRLTVYFVKRVGIRDLRFYVNYAKDESYTPTKIVFKSGTSENNLIEFAQMTLDSPVGWQQVSLQGAGGGPDGNTLVSYVLQMQILENHQNGKDTHLRGIKIYAFDAESGRGGGGSGVGENSGGSNNNPVEDMVGFLDNGSVSAATRDGGASSAQPGGSVRLSGLARQLADTRLENGEGGFTIPDFMRDPEIR